MESFRDTSSHIRRATSAADRALKAQQQRKYVRQLWLFLAAVVGFLAAIRLVTALSSARRPRSLPPSPSSPSAPQDDKEKSSSHSLRPPLNRGVSWRHLPRASLTAFRIVAFRLTVSIGFGPIGSVSELTFIIGYIVAIFIWLLVDTRDLYTAFWEDRAAHFASSNLSLVVALAGKNNLISFLTGVGHEKLNVLHRAAARTCLILLWMHAAGHVASGLPEIFDFRHSWMRWGVTGLIAFTLATVLSIRPIRQMAFEFFLVSHIILIAIFLVGGVLHTREVGFDDYIWPALVVWSSDRFIRLGRILWNNKLWKGSSQKYCQASVESLSEDTIRLRLQRSFTWRPGQHAYITLPTVSDIPTEAHPFTISSIPGSEIEGDHAIEFLIRAREGFTARLREHAVKMGSCTVPVFVDGPYGCPPDLRSFTTCILLAGGSGVSYTLPLLMETVRAASVGKSATRRVVFVWAVRDASHLTWISNILADTLAAAPASLSIEPRIYVTSTHLPALQDSVPLIYGPSASLSRAIASKPSSNLSPDIQLPSYGALRIIPGRPNIRGLLQEEIEASPGPVSVDVAGPSTIAQSVRNALCRDAASPFGVLKGAPSVTLHVETFGMVKT
ncbi:FAD-binding domain-containing protein [Amylostereum chailletii]|nr:FAD-binding domain-containing protein [Amylostereum chailletii]